MDSHQSKVDRAPSFKRMKTDALQVVIVLLVVVISIGSAVYATTLNWTSSNRIQVTTGNLSVYADAALTQTASNSVDWGTLHPGEHKSVYYWIKNDSSQALTLTWTSDLDANSVTGYVSDSWSWNSAQSWPNLSGYNLAAGGIVQTQYIVTISTITPSGTYSWALTLSGS